MTLPYCYPSRIRLCLTAIVGAALVASAAVHGRQPSAPPTSEIVSPLQDNEDQPLNADPKAVPTNPKAMTHAGLYATERQAGSAESALHDRIITVRVGCCGRTAIDRAVNQVWTTHVAYDTPVDIAVLVRGKDSLQAAKVVDRLSEAGLSRVWLVTTP